MTEVVPFELTPTPEVPAAVAAHEKRARTWREELRALAHLAWPIVLTQLAQMAVITTDILMLGAYSKDALASAAIGLPLFYAVWMPGFGLAMAVSPMIAHILGDSPRNRAGVRHCVRMGLWAAAIMTPFCLAALGFATPVLLALGEPHDLAVAADPFVRILSFGIPFSLGFNVLRSYSNALSRARAPLIVGLLTIVFNAAGDYALIFGHFGAPEMGLRGAAFASTCSYAFGFFAMVTIVLATPSLRVYRIFRRFFRPDWAKLREVFRLGVPIGLTIIAEGLFFNAGTLVMGTFGAAVVAAHSIALNVPSVTFMVPLGIGTAATVRVGLAMGARDHKGVQRAGISALAMSTIFMTLAGIVLAIAPRTIATLYVADTAANAEVIRNAVIFLQVAAAFQLLDGLQVTAALTLRGMKDATAPMWIAGACYWLIGFPAALGFAYGLHFNGLGVWLAFALALACAAAGLLLRFAFLSGLLTRPLLGHPKVPV